MVLRLAWGGRTALIPELERPDARAWHDAGWRVHNPASSMACVQGFAEVINPRAVGFQRYPDQVLNWYNYGNYVHTF